MILKVRVAVLPAASVAVILTGEVPVGNADPDGGDEMTLIVPGQLSVALTAKLTTAEHDPESVDVMI